MAITLPNARNVFIPAPPPITEKNVDAIIRYLNRLKESIEKEFGKSYDNIKTITSTGTSGSFDDSGGNTITVSSGIITGLA